MREPEWSLRTLLLCLKRRPAFLYTAFSSDKTVQSILGSRRTLLADCSIMQCSSAMSCYVIAETVWDGELAANETPKFIYIALHLSLKILFLHLQSSLIYCVIATGSLTNDSTI